jgi:hypothetical protein
MDDDAFKCLQPCRNRQPRKQIGLVLEGGWGTGVGTGVGFGGSWGVGGSARVGARMGAGGGYESKMEDEEMPIPAQPMPLTTQAFVRNILKRPTTNVRLMRPDVVQAASVVDTTSTMLAMLQAKYPSASESTGAGSGAGTGAGGRLTSPFGSHTHKPHASLTHEQLQAQKLTLVRNLLSRQTTNLALRKMRTDVVPFDDVDA